MKLTKQFWRIVAGVLLVSGIVSIFAGFALMGFDFRKLNTGGETVENKHTVDSDFSAISIDTSTADISFGVSEDDKVHVVCKETEKVIHNVSVADDTLKIIMDDNRSWYMKLGFLGGTFNQSIVIYLPKEQVIKKVYIDASTSDVEMKDMTVEEELKMNLSTGDIRLDNIKTGRLDLDTSTGDITINKMEISGDMKIDSSTGDIIIDGTKTAGEMKIDTSTGSVKFTAGDADSVKIDTSTGSIYCSFLTEKNIKADSSTGSVDVPKNGTGGSCVLNTSTGSIKVEYVK